MNLLVYIAANIVETLLRVFPFPGKTGLIKMGNPDGNSPVFLTGNYHLTVQRVKRALRGTDAYLLIANSRGINVWCAAAGGHFGNHAVISALKTSGVGEMVGHRDVILPQLAAAGIEAGVIREKTGWKVIWGPVYARNIPAFLQNGLGKSPGMREVEFPWLQRIEMAVAWAFPLSIVSALIVIPFWREAIPFLVALAWGLSLLIFVSFPAYSRWLNPGRRRTGFIFFDFGRGGFQLALWGAIMLGLATYSFLAGNLAWGFMLRWGFVSLVVVIVISLDLMGSTPVYKSGLTEDRLLKVVLDEGKCRGAGFCEQVCPRNCYEVDKKRHMATMPGAARCVQCGACIVQCPFDALCFQSPKGGFIPPESVRRFKLNLMGKRLVKPEAG